MRTWYVARARLCANSTRPSSSDEFILSFTHDVEMPALLPGIAPTGRKVTLPDVVVMGIVDGKVAYEHIYWDQASLLVQVGVLDPLSYPWWAPNRQTSSVIRCCRRTN